MIRYTEDGQEARKKQLKDLRERLAKIKRLDSYREDQGWKDLKAVIEGFIASEENAVKLGVIACAVGGYYDVQERGIRKETDSRLVSDLRVAHERKTAFQMIIDLVEKSEENARHLETTIEAVEAKLKEAKEQLA